MGLADLIGKLRQKEQEKEQTAEAAYQSLVQKAADGKPVDPAQAAAVLEAAGRTVEQFESAVGWVVHKRELRALVATRPAVEAERQRAEAEIAGYQQEIKALQDKLNPKIRAAYERFSKELPAKLAEIDRAEQELRRTAPAEAKAAIQELSAACGPLEERVKYLSDARLQSLQNAKEQRESARTARYAKDRDQYVTAAEAWEARAEEYLAEKGRVMSEMSRLKTEADRLDRELVNA